MQNTSISFFSVILSLPFNLIEIRWENFYILPWYNRLFNSKVIIGLDYMPNQVSQSMPILSWFQNDAMGQKTPIIFMIPIYGILYDE